MIVRVIGTRLIYLDGLRLAELRHAHGLTMRGAAALLGVSAAAVCFWEHEQTSPSAAQVEALHTLYGDALESSGALTVEDL